MVKEPMPETRQKPHPPIRFRLTRQHEILHDLGGSGRAAQHGNARGLVRLVQLFLPFFSLLTHLQRVLAMLSPQAKLRYVRCIQRQQTTQAKAKQT
jgi:hypothetical protein